MPYFGATKLVDANVWLALSVESHTHFEPARAWFKQQDFGACAFCRLTQLALLRLLTNAKVMGENLQTQRGAWASYGNLLNNQRCAFLHEPSSLDMQFQRLTSHDQPLHRQWSDSYLAAFAKAASLTLVSFDAGFKNVPDLQLELLTGK
jgi:uncharacterized protein